LGRDLNEKSYKFFEGFPEVVRKFGLFGYQWFNNPRKESVEKLIEELLRSPLGDFFIFPTIFCNRSDPS